MAPKSLANMYTFWGVKRGTEKEMKPLSGKHTFPEVAEISIVTSSDDHPVDCSPPGSSLHGILQARILEWVATSFSRGSSRLRD